MPLRHAGLLCVVSLALLAGCPATSDSGGQSGGSTSPSTGFQPIGSPPAGGGTGSSSSGSSTASAACAAPAQGNAWEADVLQRVNNERRNAGLAPVRYSAMLEQQAAAYACELIEYHFFAHVNPVTRSTLADRADEFGYAYWVIGENLAAGQTTPAKVMEDWMNSPGHRENILNPDFTELGVSVRVGGDHDIYWVQEFGRPRTASPPQP